MRPKLVSIVIPCYNLGEYLPEAAESVRQQTYPNWEAVIVDDGSTDPETLRALWECSRHGFRVLRTGNRGASAARNHGILHARGDYLLCLDADDVLLPAFLEETVPILEAEPEVGIVATNVELFGWRTGAWHPPDHSAVTILWKNCVPSASLFRRVCWEEAGGYKDLTACQDWEFWISIVGRGWRWSVVDRVLYRYRQRRGSISEHREANREGLLREIVALHPELYRSHWTDILCEMDAELKRQRERSERERGKAKRHWRAARRHRETIRGLEEATHTAVTALGGVLEPSSARQGGGTGRPVDPRRARVDGVNELVYGCVPVASTVMVVSKGDDDLVDLDERHARHFPAGNGGYLGYHPRDGRQAIEWLEAERRKGGEYFVIPEESFWWLDHYGDLRAHLDNRYRAILREDACVIYDVRRETEKHTFSVVICTYNRAALLGEAIRSVFRQEYPQDRFEILVVDNDSPDDTASVVAELAPASPVPLRYLVENRNGLSYARNLGIEQSRFEFVAFLDDDAIACPTWLAVFNRVIDEQHALVVGSRIEKAFEPGFSPPAWFHFQYIKHFFGVNYRDRGRMERVFRVRHPLYLTGASIAYARRLFDRFGGFNTQLGRDGKTLLAGEETFFNLVLDKNNVPIYYTDEAYVDHFVESFRVTKKHLVRKAYWSGVTSALMRPMSFGLEEARRGTRSAVAEIRRRVRQIRRSRGSPENFSRWCRIVFNLAYLGHFWPRYARMRLSGRSFDPLPRIWSMEDWIVEVERWPDGAEKHRVLYELYIESGDVTNAERALEEMERYRPVVGSKGDDLLGPLRELRYANLVEKVREVARSRLPTATTVLVVSRGDDRLIDLPDRTGWHFPRAESGLFAGHYPAGDAQAIEHVQSLRAKGARYLLFPHTSFWWLDKYPAFGRYLRGSYQVEYEDADVLIFDLTEAVARDDRVRAHAS